MTTSDNIEQEIQNPLADPNFQQTAFNSLMEIFILPSIKSRQDKGELPTPLNLVAALVLLYPDERPMEIRINEEVRGKAEMSLKPGVEIKPGDPVFSHQLEGISGFQLDDNDDPDCGYIVMLPVEGKWVTIFNFLYNGGLSKKYLRAAQQFYEASQYALKEQHWPVFVDTLFSASELAVKGLMLRHHPKLRGSKKHAHVHDVFNRFARLGNVKVEQKNVFNKLSLMRGGARYLESDIELDESDARQMLEIVGELIKEVEKKTRYSS